MRIGQQVRVTSARGPLTGLVGLVEQVIEIEGRQFYQVRLAAPYDDVLQAFKVWELSRTN